MNVPIKILEDCCTHLKTLHLVTMCCQQLAKEVKASDCFVTAFQISFILMLEHPAEGITSNGIADGFKSEVGKAVIAQTRAAIICMKCVEAHQAKKKSMHGTRTNAKADIRLHSKLCLKRNCVIADQGNKCVLVFKKENELRQKSLTNLRAVNS